MIRIPKLLIVEGKISYDTSYEQSYYDGETHVLLCLFFFIYPYDYTPC